MTTTSRWIVGILCAVGFFCGITDFGRNINWYAAIFLAVLGIFIAIIVIHARRQTEEQ